MSVVVAIVQEILSEEFCGLRWEGHVGRRITELTILGLRALTRWWGLRSKRAFRYYRRIQTGPRGFLENTTPQGMRVSDRRKEPGDWEIARTRMPLLIGPLRPIHISASSASRSSL